MHDRPQAALFKALRELGYRVDSLTDKLPAVIHGTGPRAGKCRVAMEESSQFASALILSAERGGWTIEAIGGLADNLVCAFAPSDFWGPTAQRLRRIALKELPYVKMTAKLRLGFPQRGGRLVIEPDASSGSYFWGASCLAIPRMRSQISVARWPDSGWQIDQEFPNVISKWCLEQTQPMSGEDSISRQSDLGDSIMTAIVVAPLRQSLTRFTDLGRLRVQECERVFALRTELTRCGAEVLEQGDTLVISPSARKLHGAEIETYDDHRMAMCFAVLGLKVPGIKLRNPSCVKKTFPNFFQKLAAAPPHGLGVTILDREGRKLSNDELFDD